VAIARPSCLYCGASLPAEAAQPEATAPSAPTPGATSNRVVLILDLRDAEPRAIADALGLSLFEAGQRARRGGYQLHRIAEAAEAERLLSLGLPVVSVPEADVRAASHPLLATGGSLHGDTLEALTGEGRVRIARSELLLVVRGPIAREYQAGAEWRRLRTATLEQGYRFHLHRRSELRPLELDPGAFEFGEGPEPSGSSLLRLTAWVEAVGAGAPCDDCFRLLPPALGPESADGKGATAAARALAARAGEEKDKGARVVLDNLAQFRFHSAWRGAVERRA
jgi:hypothetical protein